MKLISSARLRRLIPAGAVAAVLAFSYLAPLPSAASSVGGFGYNCGVKGFGYHDHGKPCPNRPFPGKGKGLTKLLPAGASTALGNGSVKSHRNGNPSSLGAQDSTTSSDEDVASVGKGHAWGRGHGRGKVQITF